MATKAKSVDFLFGAIIHNGEALSGGKIFHYDPGTTDVKTIWTDRDKVTPAAQPVILDANGRTEIYGDGLYRIIIKDANDVTIADMDNMEYLDDTAAAITSSDLEVAGHAEIHEDGGTEEIDVTDLSGLLADKQTPLDHAEDHTDGDDDIQDATNGRKGLMTAAQVQALESSIKLRFQVADAHSFDRTNAVYGLPIDGDATARYWIYFPEDMAKLNYSFDLKTADGADTASAKVRVNGTDVGTPQTHTGDVNFTAFQEDDVDISGPALAGWKEVDVYTKNSNGGTTTSIRKITFHFHQG